MSKNLEDLKKLRIAIGKILTELQLEEMSFAVRPGLAGQPDRLELIARIKEGALVALAEQEQRSVDEVFQSLISGLTVSEAPKEQKNKLFTEVEKWMKEED